MMEKLTREERQCRNFSESFKRKKVQEIESRQVKISEFCRHYQVTRTSVYHWIKKFGNMKSKGERLVVETDSDSKKLIELQKRVAELERMVGQKQIQIDFLSKMIDIAEETYNVDIKKNLSQEP